MPLGRYPERVKDFNKWARGRVDKAKINDSATGSRASLTRRKKRRRRSKRRLKKEEE